MLSVVVHSTASVTQLGQLKFTPVSSFSLLDFGKDFGGKAFSSGIQTGKISVSVYVLCESAVEQGVGYIKKLAV